MRAAQRNRRWVEVALGARAASLKADNRPGANLLARCENGSGSAVCQAQLRAYRTGRRVALARRVRGSAACKWQDWARMIAAAALSHRLCLAHPCILSLMFSAPLLHSGALISTRCDGDLDTHRRVSIPFTAGR